MKTNDVFTYQIPIDSGVCEIVAIVLQKYNVRVGEHIYLCYGQNRLFEIYEAPDIDEHTGEETMWQMYNGIIVEYVDIPEYNIILEKYQHELDKANDYASM